MLSKNLTYLVLSDIHIGSKNKNIIKNLYLYFTKHKRTFIKLDIIFLAGDVFDKLLNTNSDEYKQAIRWLTWLIKFCSDNEIKLRILEGTASHDWKQCSVLDTIINELKIHIDYKYYDILDIELMDNGLSVAYIPDEWSNSPLTTLTDLKNKLTDNRLEKVDLIIMHGQFPHQLNNLHLHSSHDSEEYVKLVNYYVHIGHIHKSSEYGKILATGSFDRLAHSEEEDKGGLLMHISVTGNCAKKFIPNENADLYKTIKISHTDIRLLIKDIERIIDKTKVTLHIRLDIPKNNPLRNMLKDIRNHFNGYDVTLKPIKKDKDVATIIEKKRTARQEITPDTITSVLKEELKKYNLSKRELDIFKMEIDLVK